MLVYIYDLFTDTQKLLHLITGYEKKNVFIDFLEI